MWQLEEAVEVMRELPGDGWVVIGGLLYVVDK